MSKLRQPVRQPERPAPVPAQKPKRSKAPFIILGAVAAVLLIAALSIFLFSARLDSDTSTSAVLEDREEDTAQTHSRPRTDEGSGRALMTCAAAADQFDQSLRLLVFVTSYRDSGVRKDSGVLFSVISDKAAARHCLIDKCIQIVVKLLDKHL